MVCLCWLVVCLFYVARGYIIALQTPITHHIFHAFTTIRVFGTKVGAGKGIDWGQAGCGAVPSTCHVWGFGRNTGGFW